MRRLHCSLVFGLGIATAAPSVIAQGQPRQAPPPTAQAAPRPSTSPQTKTPPRPEASPRSKAAPRPARPPTPRLPRSRSTEEATDEELLKDLERDVDDAPKQRTAATSGSGKLSRFIQSLNPEISAIASLAGAYFYDHVRQGKGNVLSAGGHDPRKSGFHLQEVELSLQAAVDPYLRLDVFLSFNTHGVHLEEAYFTSLGIPGGFQLRLGQLNHRFGRFNAKHLHTWDFVDSVAPAARLLGPEGLGGISGEVSWLLPLPWYLLLSVALTTPADSHSFVGDGARKSGYHIRDPRHLLYVFHLASFFELGAAWGLSLGLSYAVGPNNSGGYALNMTQLFGVDLFLKYRPLRRPYSEISLTAEGYGRLMQVPGDQLFDWGLYAQLSFRLSKRWFLALRYDTVQIGNSERLLDFDFAQAGADPEFPTTLDDQHRGSLSLSWQPTHFSQIRIQYNNNWTRRIDDEGHPGAFKLSHEVFLQLQGNIGAHGSHPY